MCDARVNIKWHFICFYVQSSNFLGFQYRVDSHFGPPFWIRKSRQTQNIRSAKPELVENDTFIGVSNTSGSREMTVYVFKCGVRCHFWAAILDLISQDGFRTH